MRSPKLTRRSFFKATATGVAVSAVGVASGCANTPDEVTPEPTVIAEDSATDVLNEYTDASGDVSHTPDNTWTLPLGTVLHPAEGAWLPATTAGASATPMVKGSALSLASGSLVEVVPEPLGTFTTTVIYDVRCSDSLYAWVEIDLSSRAWSLYASAFSGGALTGDVKRLWEGTSDYDPAPFTVSGSTVVWQVQPSLSGTKTSTSSFCYLWHLGDADAKAVLESPGRFATAPVASGEDLVVVTPRVSPSRGTFYGVTAYTVSDDFATKVDQLVMPQSVRPFRAARVGDNFLVSVEASYSSGGLLGQMGTYMGNASAGFARLSREPSECGCGKGELFVVKSQASYFLIDHANKSYSFITSVDRSVDYGDYPARVGECDQFVTFSTVKDEQTGYPASVTVRTFRL